MGINTNNPNGAALNVNGTIVAINFVGAGAGLTGLNASQLASGTIPVAQLPSVVVTNGASGVNITGTFNGNGSGLTGVALLAGGNTFSGNQTIDGMLKISDGSGASNFTDVTIGPGGYYSGEQHSINFDDGAGHIGSLIVGYNGMGYFRVGNLYNGGHQTSTTAFTVLGNGNVGIGTTTPAAPLHVVNTNLSTTSAGIYSFSDGGSTTDTHPSGSYYTAGGEFAGANGVIGAATTNQSDGYGVIGIAPGTSGRGVYGRATSLTGTTYGVFGESDSTNGAGVYATGANSSSPALTIATGGIRVAGAGIETSTAAFTHLTAAANITGVISYINNPLCNGDPNAILIVTHNYNPAGTTTAGFHAHPIGVYYDYISKQQWAILNDDGVAMATNIAFNVLIIKK